jgi:hypothetical protein
MRLDARVRTCQGWERDNDHRLLRHERSVRRSDLDLSVAYADRAERDHAALKVAIRNGKITAYDEE